MAGSKVGSTAAGLAKGFWSSFLTQALSWCPGELGVGQALTGRPGSRRIHQHILRSPALYDLGQTPAPL